MPKLTQATVQPDLTNYQQVQPQQPVQQSLPQLPVSQMNPFLRCPLPYAANSSTPDNLRQYYNTGVPQYRLNPPAGIK